MDKKKLIQIVVIIAAFGGSGIVLYNGFFKPAPVVPAAMVTAAMATPGSGAVSASLPVAGGVAVSPVAVGGANPLLPYGGKLDFSPLSPTSTQPFQFDAISYPALNTSTEVGIYDQAHQAYTQPLIQVQAPVTSQQPH